ncbi:MAG: S16 family serine protease, partial [bacterium]|nr:S16 family serine protease [bacterium]
MPNTGSYVFLDQHKSSQKILQTIRSGKSPYLFAVMSDPQIKDPPDKFYRIGVIAEAEADRKEPVITLRGLFRAEMLRLMRIGERDWGFWVAAVKNVADENHDDYFIQAHLHVMADMIKIRDLLVSFMIRARGEYEFDHRLMSIIIDEFENTDWEDKNAVDNFIWATLRSVPDLLQKDKQPLLESTSLLERIELCIKKLKERLKLLEIQKQNISKDGQLTRRASRRANRRANNLSPPGPIDPTAKDDDDEFIKGSHGDIKKRWDKFNQVRGHMSEDARDVAMEDFKSLMSFGSPQGNHYEWPKFMKHLDFILDLPWKEETAQESNIAKVAGILDEDHYGLQRVKDRICESIAPKILNPEGKGHIICFIGPPGVGKTSLAKSIARSLNKKYTRISVGGVRDEAQIRGHGVTYIGSQPGEILKLMKRCAVRNPVFVIDEIDKLGSMSVSGDPSSAMLEVFDPEQNNSFKDHYAGCGFDLSRVMFIATGNVEGDIQLALRDRMDIIRLPGYLEVEKIEIAKRYLIPRWMKEVGLTQNDVEVEWEEGLLAKLIRGYTNEAGVRNIERTIATILRKVSRAYLQSKNEGNSIFKFEITESNAHEYLGPPKFTKDRARLTVVGEAVGLAWTPVGGEILYVQAEFYDRLNDKKVLDLTGMQGEVMKESDKLALTRLRRILRATNPKLADKLKSNSIHLHIPEGSIPKDGP